MGIGNVKILNIREHHDLRLPARKPNDEPKNFVARKTGNSIINQEEKAAARSSSKAANIGSRWSEIALS